MPGMQIHLPLQSIYTTKGQGLWPLPGTSSGSDGLAQSLTLDSSAIRQAAFSPCTWGIQLGCLNTWSVSHLLCCHMAGSVPDHATCECPKMNKPSAQECSRTKCTVLTMRCAQNSAAQDCPSGGQAPGPCSNQLRARHLHASMSRQALHTMYVDA